MRQKGLLLITFFLLFTLNTVEVSNAVQPRFEAGKFGQSIIIEEGTTNIIPLDKQLFVGWNTYLGSNATLTQNQTVAEWNTSTATRIQISGGTATTKYYLQTVVPSVNGQKYATQVKLKTWGQLLYLYEIIVEGFGTLTLEKLPQ